MAEKKVERASLKKINAQNKKEYKKFCDEYIEFLTQSRTPTEGVEQVIKRAKALGYKEWTPKATGKGFYIINEDGTNAAIVKLGTIKITDGLNIMAAHLDSPCLTAKINPIREKPEGIALDCYPYGGIFAHQWFDTPVDVIGYCIKAGKNIKFEIPGMISDSTIHLSGAERTQKKYKEAFEAESLDVFIGFKDKKEFLTYMKKESGIEEKDFARSMLTVVPKTTPYMISQHYLAGFGQDDKVCSFAQMKALADAKIKRTAITLFFDREEIGSTGYNGANSKFLEHVIDVIAQINKMELTDVQIRRIFAKSKMISADVDVAYNSNDVPFSQEESASKFGDGLVMDRLNGGANQSYGNNVPIHITDKYMELFKKHKIQFKVSAIPPKVNSGGGGTIAMYFAHRGISVADMGIPVLNMHGKNSIVFLPDFYQMIKGYTVFFESVL